MSGPPAGRKTGNPNGQSKRVPSSAARLITNVAPAQSPPAPTSATAPTSIQPDDARHYLETEGVLKREIEVTFDTIFDALINIADNPEISDEVIKTRVRALAHVGQKYTREFIAIQTIKFVGDRLDSIQKEQEGKANDRVEEVRTRLEAEKAELAVRAEGNANMKDASLMEIGKEITSLKETILEMKGNMDKLNRTTHNLDKPQHATQNDTQEPRGWGYGGPDSLDSNSIAWGGYHGPQFESSRPNTYATVVASTCKSIYTMEEHNTRRQDKLNKLRGGENKRDCQILLNPEDINGDKYAINLTESELKEKIDKAIATIAADELLQSDPRIEVKCEKVTKQPKGGALLLMNLTKAKDFLTQPDICERFAESLGLSAKIIPRKYHVVLERIPITINLDDPTLPKQIEQDNGLCKGKVIGIKWIKNPTRVMDTCKKWQYRSKYMCRAPKVPTS